MPHFVPELSPSGRTELACTLIGDPRPASAVERIAITDKCAGAADLEAQTACRVGIKYSKPISIHPRWPCQSLERLPAEGDVIADVSAKQRAWPPPAVAAGTQRGSFAAASRARGPEATLLRCNGQRQMLQCLSIWSARRSRLLRAFIPEWRAVQKRYQRQAQTRRPRLHQHRRRRRRRGPTTTTCAFSAVPVLPEAGRATVGGAACPGLAPSTTPKLVIAIPPSAILRMLRRLRSRIGPVSLQMRAGRRIAVRCLRSQHKVLPIASRPVNA